MAHVSQVQCCFTSTETVGLLGKGAQDGHLDFHTAPELRTGAELTALQTNFACSTLRLNERVRCLFFIPTIHQIFFFLSFFKKKSQTHSGTVRPLFLRETPERVASEPETLATIRHRE